MVGAAALARCRELRSLELRNYTANQETGPLADDLSGCVHLQRLLFAGCCAVSTCLSAGLCALRRLEVPHGTSMRDAKLAAMLSLLPQLEVVSVNIYRFS